MAKYGYTVANDTPVRMELTVHEMRTLCSILQREVARKGEDRWFAGELHAQLVEAIGKAGDAMRCEGDWLTKSTIQHLTDGLNDAQEQADKLEA
jgi:hypothetical protein